MKLGLCIEMVFTDMPFTDRLRKAADSGLKCCEMWLTDLSFKGKPEELSRIAQKNSIKITNTVINAPDGSIGGSLTNPSDRSCWLERAKATLNFNKAAGINAAIVCTGNVIDGLSTEKMRQSVVDGLKSILDMAHKYEITLLLEALNTHDHPCYFLTGSDQAASICNEINSEYMKMLFDCYHMQIMEGNLITHIERNIHAIGHFHAAGVPGRNELYLGEINYPQLISQIRKFGYKDVFALEYSATVDPFSSLAKSMQCFNAGLVNF